MTAVASAADGVVVPAHRGKHYLTLSPQPQRNAIGPMASCGRKTMHSICW